MADEELCPARNGKPHLYTGMEGTESSCSACGAKKPAPSEPEPVEAEPVDDVGSESEPKEEAP